MLQEIALRAAASFAIFLGPRGTNNVLLETKMPTEDNARDLASHWIRAWNAHDLDEIMSDYPMLLEGRPGKVSSCQGEPPDANRCLTNSLLPTAEGVDGSGQ